jgi:4-hydroxybenzoate polyprenyltransferase
VAGLEAVTRRAPVAALRAVVRAAHIGPTLAVTLLTALLAGSLGLEASRAVLVTAAVLAGQLTIGWGNDLLDAARDRRVGRGDKPLAAGEVSERTVGAALAAAAVACLGLSVALGWPAGLVNLVLHVGSGQAYNLGLKATVWSWAPYAVAFGTLPSLVSLAGDPPVWAPGWTMAAAASLGVAAHLLNVLPDLDDDAATGVRGLPHRLGPRLSRTLATGLLLGASVLAVVGPAGPPPAWAWSALAVSVALAAVALVGRGRTPFRAAMASALVAVVLLVAVG